VDYVKVTKGEKIIFGTNFPITDPHQHLEELEKLGLSGETKRNFLRDNAKQLFNLER
jgi:predicted TIM-barrel fold metal-dependent hydrolase